MRKQIGYLCSMKLYLEGTKKQMKNLELAKELVGDNQYIFFKDYADGHHPKFFKKYPKLMKYAERN